MLGIPYDRKSSFLQGPALAPPRIREILTNGAGNDFTEHTQSPLTDPRWSDLGDFPPTDYFDIEKIIADILARPCRTLTLGGDHSITFPVVKACAAAFGTFSILHIDAHGDLYDSLDGDPYSHACPFARIMENGLARRLVQVGVRTFTPHQREQAARFGVETIEMTDFENGKRPHFDGPVYISLDLDGLDPAFAPGVSHHEPGGLTTREVLRLIQSLDVPVIGADIVELNPHRDVHGMTAAVAAKFLKEIAAKMLG
ncbi:MAG: agmatinase [Bacteroidetes bacterium]|nr:MAG: agmatinase [Bacteroidota bacterium]